MNPAYIHWKISLEHVFQLQTNKTYFRAISNAELFIYIFSVISIFSIREKRDKWQTDIDVLTESLSQSGPIGRGAPRQKGKAFSKWICSILCYTFTSVFASSLTFLGGPTMPLVPNSSWQNIICNCETMWIFYEVLWYLEQIYDPEKGK